MSVERSGASDRDGPDDESLTLPDNSAAQFAARMIGQSEAAPGTVIGSYHLLQPIGHGGMGVRCGWPSRSNRSAGASRSN